MVITSLSIVRIAFDAIEMQRVKKAKARKLLNAECPNE